MPRVKDFNRLYGYGQTVAHLGSTGLIGTEPEGWYLDPLTADAANLGEPDDDQGVELYACQVESATAPRRSLVEAGVELYERLNSIVKSAESKGVLFSPASNFAIRKFTAADFHPHPYIPRIVESMGGPEKASYFDGSSQQVTVEHRFPYASEAFAANHFSVGLAYLVSRFTADSFAAYGTLNPRYPGFEHIQPEHGFRTARYFSRVTGSPEAGPLLWPFPYSETESLALIHRRMRDGDMPTPGRAAGQHTDVRERPDHGPYGATEYCVPETNGHRIESNMAVAALLRGYHYAIARAHHNNEMGRLVHENRLIAHLRPEEMLELAITNSELAAQNIPSLTLTSLNGFEVTPQVLWWATVSMVDKETRGTDYELTPGAIELLYDLAVEPPVSEMRTDSHGFVDVSAPYRGAPGTFSIYKRALALQFIDRLGFTEQEAIAAVNTRQALFFKDYLRQFRPERDLAFLENAAVDNTR